MLGSYLSYAGIRFSPQARGPAGISRLSGGRISNYLFTFNP